MKDVRNIVVTIFLVVVGLVILDVGSSLSDYLDALAEAVR